MWTKSGFLHKSVRASSIPMWSVAVMLLGCFLGCGREEIENRQPPEVSVVVTSPIKKRIVEWDEYVGRLDPVEFVEVRARVSGYLKSIHFVEGQVVNKGDLLCVIDPRPFQAELNSAKAGLKQAEARVTQATAQQAQAKAEQGKATAALDYARRRLDRSRTLLAKNTVTKDEYELQQSEVLTGAGRSGGCQRSSGSSQGGQRDGRRRGPDGSGGSRDCGPKSGIHSRLCPDHRPR